jgi:hypothetical protein
MTMRKLRDLAWFVGFCILILPTLVSKLGAQQGPRPIVKQVATDNPIRLDPSLPWLSEYSAPFIYQKWWAEIAQCEGLPLPADSLRKVQYFQVNGPDFIPDDLDAVVFAVTYQNNQTYVSEPYIWNEALIKHEALHLLLKWAGDPTWYMHDPIRFLSCGLSIAGEPAPNP